jgi:hypothetical protein
MASDTAFSYAPVAFPGRSQHIYREFSVPVKNFCLTAPFKCFQFLKIGSIVSVWLYGVNDAMKPDFAIDNHTPRRAGKYTLAKANKPFNIYGW